MKFRLLVLFFFHQWCLLAQHPAFVPFAEKEFRGIDIYDVIQDEKNHYWFATNQGIRVHDGYTFRTVTCPEMKSQSVFRWVKDELGSIYCFNLQHQIFRIQNGAVELYYEIPKEYRHHEIRLEVDLENHLLIQSKGLIRIAPNKKKIKLFGASSFPNSSAISFELLTDGSTITASQNGATLLQKNGTIQRSEAARFNSPKYKGAAAYIWFRIKNRVYAVDYSTMNVFLYNETTKIFTYVTTFDTSVANATLRIYVTEKHVWLGGISNGMLVYDHNLTPLFNEEPIYTNHFISDIFTDKEGNLLLSTFNEGVKLIFNPEVIGFDLDFGEKFSRICSSKHTIFATSNKGNIYAFNDGSRKLIYTDPLQQEINSIHYWEAREMLFFASGNGLIIGKWNGTTFKKKWVIDGSFKHVYFEGDQTAIAAFNFGAKRITISENEKINYEHLFNGRTYCISRSASSLYAGAAAGLVQLNADGTSTPVSYKGNTISAISVVKDKSTIYFGTRKNGVLISKNDAIVGQIPFEGTIHKVEVFGDYLFVLSNRSIYRVRKDGKEKELLNKACGLFFDYVSDFHVYKERLYITNSASMQYIDIDELDIKPAAIPLSFIGISEDNGTIKNNRLSFNAKNIQFEVGVSTLRYRGELKYKYRLKGFNRHWKYASYIDNKINYATLPPGDYTLEVIALNGTVESDPIRYSFQVKAPYYQQWWFYIIIIVASGLLIALFFLLRINRIRKKNKAKLAKQRIQSEMLESELKALRSQMNPHFIFNSLNSIQDLILQEETDASYDYIVLFAELVRSALNYSNKDFIPIVQEIEFINVYLQLEKLRFKEDFEYSIECNAPDFLNVPSMLIQPFIENALLHGLLHKPGKKVLSIRFEFDETLICYIQDNGIGRKKAAEIQTRQGRKHESFALDAINKRLKILNEKLGNEQGAYSMQDVDASADQTGTLVTIQLPFQRDY